MRSILRSPEKDVVVAQFVAQLRDIARMVWRDRRHFRTPLVLAIGVGLLVAFGNGSEYVARTRILPYRSGPASMSSLSGLAGLAGVRLPTGLSEQTITADLYPEIARSQDFLVTVVRTPLRFGILDRPVSTVDYFQEVRRRPPLELFRAMTLGLPGTIRKAVGGGASAAGLATDSSLAYYDRDLSELLEDMPTRLAVSIEKKTSIITIIGTMPDPVAAADLVRTSSHLLMERIIAYESRKAAEQFRFVEIQWTKARGRYDEAQRALAVFTDRNRMLGSAVARLEQDRLERERDLAFELYQQFSRELEQARIKMNQDLPVFTVIEQVAIPADRSSPRRLWVLLAATLVGLLIGGVRVGLRLAVAAPT